jgi:hypothetical protein
MSDSGSNRQFFTRKVIGSAVGLVFSFAGAVAIAAFNQWGPFAPTPKPCLISGAVLNTATNEPLAGVMIGLDRWSDDIRDNEEVVRNAVMTANDGSYTLDCRDVPADAFPLRIVLRHRDWRATHLTSVRVDRGDNRTGVNIAVEILRGDLACPPNDDVAALAPGAVGDVITVNTRDGSRVYDFVAGRISADLHAGDFYFSHRSCAQFWANNRGQRGLVDLGAIDTPLDQVRPPSPEVVIYRMDGVRALVGHTYAALPQEGRNGFVVFRVLDIASTPDRTGTDSYTVQYVRLPE